MNISDIFSIIANTIFSASAAGTLVLILFFTGGRLFNRYRLDGVILKLAVIFAVLWVIDIGIYIYLSFVI